MEILLAWSKGKKPLDLYIHKIASGLSPQNQAFCRSLVYTVLRQRQYLEHVITLFSRYPLHKMKPKTIITLEIGVAQLIFMDHVPESAAVHSTVGAFKASGQPRWLVGFVNGLLRTVAKNTDSLPGSDNAMQDKQPILNHPEWQVKRWAARFGRKICLEICRVNNYAPVLTLRVNTRLLSREELVTMFVENRIAARLCPYSPVGILLPRASGAITELPGYRQGAFAVQDTSAQLATLLLGVGNQGKRFLDGCAGLGGKTTHIAQDLPGAGTLVAVEPDHRRNNLLKENLKRLQLTSQVNILKSNLEEYAATKPEPFDGILLDVPCSGTGVIRRKPDIRWTRELADLEKLATRQSQLLSLASSLVAAGGRLVYATCSLEPEENEQIVTNFLKRHPTFFLADARKYLPDSSAELVDSQGFFRPLPGPEHDGFFAAVLQRRTSFL
ncbi:MAG: 16S rRNA (cytosine(967)-C(5))-methyltransferase [Desulfobulbus propionicus]|nr:MAG: 16S rRNA (cytosine(967)-C(5))-methyltransferase [Desulfobulbus propionicus]